MDNNEAVELVRRGEARWVEATRTDVRDWVDQYGDSIDPIYVGGSKTVADSCGYAEEVFSVVVLR